MSACEGSCINGPGMPHEKKGIITSRAMVEKIADKKKDYDVVHNLNLNKRIDLDLPRQNIPGEAAIWEILAKTGKTKPEDMLNCCACGYSTCWEKAIAVYQGKAELYMCLPYINDLSQSLSNVTLSVSPNLILAVDRDLRIVELNLTAQKLFGVTRQMALKADLYEFMDPADFEEVFQTHRNILDKKVKLDPLNIITSQTLIYVPDQELVMGFIKDITEEEQAKEKNFRARLESAEMAQKVIEKQMIAAQEIASLLGETTAETKVTLNLLKDLMLDEAGSADRKG